jgi:RND family efflux transporter MFP subunit
VGFALLFLILLALALGGLFLMGFLPLQAEKKALVERAQAVTTGVAHVRVALPKAAPDQLAITIPATLAAAQQTTVYARATGFVRAWKHDLGDHVNAGEVLATIDAPDTDQDLAQAQAALAQAQAQVAQAQANQELARVSLKRLQGVGVGIASQQDIDAQQAAYDAATASVRVDQAAVTANAANVERLQALVSFETVTAPFSGVVTARSVQVGALVTAGTGSGQALFQVSQVDPMLVFLNLPQAQSSGIAVGAKATVSIRDLGDATFTGTVSNLAGLLDPNAHTMVVELRIPNADGRLFPGMYASASLTVPTRRRLLTIPATGLLFGAKGAQVAVVKPDGHVHLQEVAIDLDTGALLYIGAGLAPEDRVILDPGEYVAEGATAEIVADESQSASATGAATATGAVPASATGAASAR